MRYATGAAFRMALADRLREESLSTGLPLSRLRRTIAFDRLLARMVTSSPDAWLLKGGFALQGCGLKTGLGQRKTSILCCSRRPKAVVPCYPLVQHVAEKVHALTRSRGNRDNSRVKDLVDLVVMAEQYSFEAAALEAAIRATFEAQSHAVPQKLPEPPAAWRAEYQRMRRDVGATAEDIDRASLLLDAFVLPVLRGTTRGQWLPAERHWAE